jgi:Domain of unknown function (DUF4373)
MARPNKQSVDYFPLDVHLDDKFKFIEIKYKLEGFAIIIKLLQKIYASSYWYKWTEDEALLFSDEIRADYDLVVKVVNEAIERDLFDKDLYETYSILTSKGIQKRYKEIVRKRKDVEIKEEYLLIDGTFGVNGGINSINDDGIPESGGNEGGRSTQSKSNHIKEEYIKKDINQNQSVKKEQNSFLSQYADRLTEEQIKVYEEFDRLIEDKYLLNSKFLECIDRDPDNFKKYLKKSIDNAKNQTTTYSSNSNKEWMKVMKNEPNDYPFSNTKKKKTYTAANQPVFNQDYSKKKDAW